MEKYLTKRAERAIVLTALYVSPEQLRDLVRRSCIDDVPLEEAPLLDLLRGEALYLYARQWPQRAQVIRRFLGGEKAELACIGCAHPVTARDWVRSYLRFAVGLVQREADHKKDKDILRSICSLTHGRAERGGSGNRIKLTATLCPGCGA